MPSSSDVRRPFLVERAHRENFGSSELQLCTLKGNVVFGGRKEGVWADDIYNSRTDARNGTGHLELLAVPISICRIIDGEQSFLGHIYWGGGSGAR